MGSRKRCAGKVPTRIWIRLWVAGLAGAAIGLALAGGARAHSASAELGLTVEGEVFAGNGQGDVESHDRTAAMAVLEAMGISMRARRAGVHLSATREAREYPVNSAKACLDWEVMVQPSPGLGDTVFMRLLASVAGGTGGFREGTADYVGATWQYLIYLNGGSQPASVSAPSSSAAPDLLTGRFEVPVGVPFSLRQCLSGQLRVDENPLLDLLDPDADTYDVFGGLDFTAVPTGVEFSNRVADGATETFEPVAATYTVDGGPPALQAGPPTLADQLRELTRATIRGEIEALLGHHPVLFLSGSEALEPLVANLPVGVVAEVERELNGLRYLEATFPLAEGTIDAEESGRRHYRANETGALFHAAKTEPTYAQFLEEREAGAGEILTFSLLQWFFGADPFAASYALGASVSLPLPDPSTLTLEAGPGDASVTLVLPPLWGGGSRSPEVLGSRATVRFADGELELLDLETEIASYEVLGGQQTGVNRGYVPSGAQLHSEFDASQGSLAAHGEGHITNDLYPPERPVFVFQDLTGRLRPGEAVAEAVAENEPMIVPGEPGGPPAPQPVAFAAVRAFYDRGANELRLRENTDPAQPPDISVVLTPQAAFGFGLDNAGEPVVGAAVSVGPLALVSPAGEGEGAGFSFSDAAFDVGADGGTFASGRFTNVRIDPEVSALVADVEFDEPAGWLASPFVENWRSDPGPVVLLGRIGTLDLVAATGEFSGTGESPTDFMGFTRRVTALPVAGEAFRIVVWEVAGRAGGTTTFAIGWTSRPGETYRIDLSTDGQAWSTIPGAEILPSQGLRTSAQVDLDAGTDPASLVRVVRR